MPKKPEDRQPWFKFFPSDWLGDESLRMCTPLARALWIDCICVMHKADPYGHFLINGSPPTERQIAVLCGLTMDEAKQAMDELESMGVFSRTRNGIIYSRRMVRERKKAETAKKNGRKSEGNPKLKGEKAPPPSDGNKKGNSASDNQESKKSVNQDFKTLDIAHMPEARGQSIDNTHTGRQTLTSSARDGPPADGGKDPLEIPATLRRSPTNDEYRNLVPRVVDAARLDERQKMPLQLGPLRQWLADGITADQIVEGIRTVASKPGYTPDKPDSVNYFREAVLEAAEPPPFKDATHAGWKGRFHSLAYNGPTADGWPPEWGGLPGTPQYQGPKDLEADWIDSEGKPEWIDFDKLKRLSG